MQRGSNTKYYRTSLDRTKSNNDIYANINTAVALARTNVPVKHKQLASNYVLIRKIFGSSAAAIPITQADRAVLSRHGFMPLEYTSISHINRQIEQLKNWANGGDILLGAYAQELLEIRIKELKYIRLTVTSGRNTEFKQGYLALEKYIEYIAGWLTRKN